MDSSALIEMIKNGDSSAGEILVEVFQVKVFNICLSLLQNVQDAEDVTQDVFIEVIKGLSKYRAEAEPGTWIYRIAVNRSLNFIRDNKKRKWWKQIDELFSLTSEREDSSAINSLSVMNLLLMKRSWRERNKRRCSEKPLVHFLNLKE